jgi:hypothetical protein
MKTSIFGTLRETLRRNRKNEIFKMVTTLGVVTVLGVGVAAAAISIGPQSIDDPSMRPLSAVPGLIVSPAFGPDDEDCTLATRPQPLPKGHVRLDRQTVCVQ